MRTASISSRLELPEVIAALARISAIADRAALVLLMIAAGMLLFRPGDLVPALAGIPIYEVVIGLCLLTSFPRVAAKVSPRSLRANGITSLVLLLVPAVMLSHLVHANTYDARLGGMEMAKACVFFLLVVALVNTMQRMRAILAAVVAGVFAMTVLAVLQYHGVVNFAALQPVEQHTGDPSNPEMLVRLCGVGVFNDPNDYSLILITAFIVCASWIGGSGMGRWRPARWGLLLPMALFGYALMLTHSRGGTIAAIGAAMVFIPARFGWRNALLVGCLVVPLLFVPSWERPTQTDPDDPRDTFQTRMELWHESLQTLRSEPLLGIGQGKLVDTIGQVTHNSYLHAFAELGLLGGPAFIGAFYFTLRGLWRVSPTNGRVAQLRPYVLALTFGYATGLLSLSRCYTVPTQLVLALGTAYLALASPSGGRGAIVPRWGWRCVIGAAGIGAAFLAATYVFVRVMMQGSGS